MAYSISVVREKQMLLLVFDGRHDPAQGMAGCQEAAAVCERENIHLVLVDIRGIDPIPMTMNQIYSIQSSLPDIFSKSCRIAVVYNPALWPKTDTVFAENVCCNRGLQLRSFPTLPAAEQWLLTEN